MKISIIDSDKPLELFGRIEYVGEWVGGSGLSWVGWPVAQRYI